MTGKIWYCGEKGTEEELFDMMRHTLKGRASDDLHGRIEVLEEIADRTKTGSLVDVEKAIGLLLNITKVHGGSDPECSLIVDCLFLLVTNYDDAFQKVLDGLRGQEEQLLFSHPIT